VLIAAELLFQLVRLSRYIDDGRVLHTPRYWIGLDFGRTQQRPVQSFGEAAISCLTVKESSLNAQLLRFWAVWRVSHSSQNYKEAEIWESFQATTTRDDWENFRAATTEVNSRGTWHTIWSRIVYSSAVGDTASAPTRRAEELSRFHEGIWTAWAYATGSWG
jgi:hypothetical protein